ncbi:hypothetical protein JCM5296_005121 [Sporobolomyces johnsonii]
MKRFIVSSAVLALLPSLVSATYFTSPQDSTVWDTAVGQTITWYFQAGGATTGDLVLEAVTLNSNSQSPGSNVTVGSSIDLTSESYTFPSGVALRSNTKTYNLLLVNSADPSYAYATVGPFEIDSFTGTAATSSVAATTTSSSEPASDLTEGAAHTATNPAVSTATSSDAPLSTVTAGASSSSSSSSSRARTSSVSRSSSTRSSSSPSSTASSSPASSSSSPSAKSTATISPSSSESKGITSTIVSTASGVLVTSTLLPNSTSSSSSSTATATLLSSTARASSSAAKTSGAPSTRYASRVGAAALAAVCGWVALA